MFQRILVPLDGSDLANQSLETAFTLADRGGGEIILLRIPVLARISALAVGELPLLEDAMKTRRHQSENYLKYIKESYRDWDVPVRIRVTEGDVASVIVDTAESERIDLIVMSTHGRSGFSRWLLGSITEKVLRHAPCPVLALRAQAIPSQILIPLDGSIIAGRSLRSALEVARLLEAQVTLLRVVPSEEELAELNEAGLQAEEIAAPDRLIQTTRQDAQTYLQAAANEYDQPEMPALQTAITIGTPAEGILEYVEANEIDLIVMTTHGHTGLRRWEYGSVTEKVMHGARCSMLIIRAAFS